MIKNIYDLSEKRDYTKNKMFLDESGPVSLQRYDISKYEKIREYTAKQRGNFWQFEEISLQKDKLDMLNASNAIKHIFTSNLLRQTALDGHQSRFPTIVFGPCTSIPELEELFNWWSTFEILHSAAYSHIIKNIYEYSVEEFNKIHNIQPIIEMSYNIGLYYDNLYKANCYRVIISELDDYRYIDSYEHKILIWKALHASYALEAIRFLVSFATSLAMKELSIFMGNGSEIELIMRDELLHTDWTAYLINLVVQDDEDFFNISKDSYIQEGIYKMYMDVIEEEKQWANYLFIEGPIIGLNSSMLSNYVDWTASNRLKLIGIDYDIDIKSNPLPWMEKYTGLGDNQKAPQETELVSYVIGSLQQNVHDIQIDNIYL